MDKVTFGGFLAQKRMARGMTLRDFAGKMKISPVYASNLEKDRVAVSAEDTLAKIAAVLGLDAEETTAMQELADKSQCVPAVTPDFLEDTDFVCVSLRMAKEADVADPEWQTFIEKLLPRLRNADSEKGVS